VMNEPMTTMQRRKPIAREVIMARAAKAAATKIAKRVTITCLGCGKEWKEKPCRATAKYCSTECSGKGRRKGPIMRTCLQCGAPFEIRWPSVVRLTCSRVCAGMRHTRFMKERRHSPIQWVDRAKWLASTRTEEVRRAISAGNLGKVRTGEKSKRFSPFHTRAVECFLRSPRNIVYYVRNITRFVHENAGLFPPETVIWTQHSRYKTSLRCAATTGLSMVARGARMSWRGWTVVSGREGRERFDLIGRNETRLEGGETS
jgi:hypothetical protein